MNKGIAPTATATSGSAVRHWRYQRLSAVLLLPLTLWFIYELVTLPSPDYPAVRAWLASGPVATLFVLFIPVLFYHAQTGLQVVLEDYVTTEWKQTRAIILMRFILAASALLAIFSVMAVCAGI